MKIAVRKQCILHFDLEARPLSWYGGDYVTKEVTAIAWGWSDQKYIDYTLLHPEQDHIDVYEFMQAYDHADIVTGHYIRGFDLPLLNALMVENGYAPLSQKLTSDTKLDLLKRHGMSNSQENLSAEFNVKAPKVLMTQADWREANRLTARGLDLTQRRVVADVKQHKELRKVLNSRDLLGPPKLWTGKASGKGKYTA